jgi:hypothetical protein
MGRFVLSIINMTLFVLMVMISFLACIINAKGNKLIFIGTNVFRTTRTKSRPSLRQYILIRIEINSFFKTCFNRTRVFLSFPYQFPHPSSLQFHFSSYISPLHYTPLCSYWDKLKWKVNGEIFCHVISSGRGKRLDI